MSAAGAQSITDVSVEWPSAGELWRTLTLQAGYNTTLVLVGATLLGIAAGVIGAFALLRKRALMGDALAHCTLPGIGAAFLGVSAFGMVGKSLLVLLPGAAVTGVLGILAVQALARHTRLRDDAAIAVVLSTFFGAGIVLMSAIQSLSIGTQGGLDTFIYGQTAAMSATDATVIASAALATILAVTLLLKEFAIVCFDEEFAAVQGWPVHRIDLLMMSLVVAVTVIGLQAVGLILIVAMLIIPPAAARFWSDRLWVVVALAGALGGLSGYAGASASALLPRMPAGAVIVLTAGVVFAVSMLAAPRHGLIGEGFRLARLRLVITRDHLLRSMHEALELEVGDPSLAGAIPGEAIARRRRRGRMWLGVTTGMARLAGLLERTPEGFVLTARGRREAIRVTRSHRLWEQYLITYADVAPSHVDFSADYAEHALSPEITRELEAALARRGRSPESLPDHTRHAADLPE